MKRLLAWLTALSLVCSPQIALSQILLPILAGSFPAGGGGTSIAWDGTVQTNSTLSGTTTNVTYSTSGASRLVVCGLAIDGGTTATGVSVSGSTLGTFSNPVSTSRGGQWTGVFFHWAASTITTETITASWTNAQQGALSCRAVSGAKDPTALTAGTNYAIASTTSAVATDCTISTTTKVANSWLVGSCSFWSTNTLTPDASTTSLASHVPGAGNSAESFDTRSDQPLAVGSYSLGETATSGGIAIATMEILVGP